MKSVEKWGVNVDDAVSEALKELDLERNEVDVEVLEESSNGFLGIGSKLARVKVTPKEGAAEAGRNKKASFDDIDKILSELPENKVNDVPEELRKDYDKFAEEELEDVRTIERTKAEEKEKERNKRKRKTKRREIPYENGMLFSEIKNLDPAPDHPLRDFLSEMADKMGLQLTFEVRAGEEMVYVEVSGPDTGSIIGKRGATLDAVQYLSSLIVNKDSENYIRVVMDAEDYRSKREQTLINLANRLAGKVERTKRSVMLEPMNPYERKVIHSTLQANPKVTTRSEGKDPYRRVVIEMR